MSARLVAGRQAARVHHCVRDCGYGGTYCTRTYLITDAGRRDRPLHAARARVAMFKLRPEMSNHTFHKAISNFLGSLHGGVLLSPGQSHAAPCKANHACILSSIFLLVLFLTSAFQVPNDKCYTCDTKYSGPDDFTTKIVIQKNQPQKTKICHRFYLPSLTT